MTVIHHFYLIKKHINNLKDNLKQKYKTSCTCITMDDLKNLVANGPVQQLSIYLTTRTTHRLPVT